MSNDIRGYDLYKIFKEYRKSEYGLTDYECSIGECIEEWVDGYFEQDSLHCPIEMKLILEPTRIVYDDNSTSKDIYEHRTISRWMQKKATCPMTRRPIKRLSLDEEMGRSTQDKLQKYLGECYDELPDDEKRGIDEAINFLRLIWAIKNGDTGQVLRRLINDANVKGVQGKTALHYAVISNNTDMVSLLLEARANVNAKDNQGETALHYAASSNNIDMVSLLLEAGANINARDGQGKTALHCAVISNNTDIVNCLLQAGAKANIKDNGGKKPLSFTKNKEIIGLFKSLPSGCLSNVTVSCLVAPFSIFCGRDLAWTEIL
ncbi:MAG: ankyrin repeat domain-containing protein [Wolbachia sp.]